METARKLFFRHWRALLVVVSLSLIAYLLYFNRLSTLVPGYSTAEINTYYQANDWHHIASNPINAPYTILVWFFTALLHRHILATRVVAAGFGVVITFMFYVIIRQWYSFRIAFLGALLFATSSGFLHFARLGTGQVLQMFVLAFIAFMIWYQREHTYHKFVGYGLAATLALLWYVPGMIWYEVLGLLVMRTYAQERWRSTPRKHLVGWGATLLLVLAPLLAASLGDMHILLKTVGLPTSLSTAIHPIANLRAAMLSASAHGFATPLLWIGRAPLLTASELILGALGVYGYLYQDRSPRALLLASMAAVSIVLVSLGGAVTLASLIPLVYLFVIHGLRQLLGQWLNVFPRNPIARFTGIGIICAMLFFSVLYQVRAYFVAWPHTATTLQAYNLPPPQ
ncbi:MAG TPA: glycosyltransferase family 39 protein [Candidatus Saccharimonadia bacterium]|nr:glycosyltransferase family 39 protein [Candidatus Saccharimonadia bacterium]